MKKTVTTLLILIACMATANAQKVTGSFAPLKDEARVKMNIDFSEADIMGMSEEEFTVYETDWTHDKVEIISLFYTLANEAMNGALVVGNYKFETDYTLDLLVRTVDIRGNYDCDLILLQETENGLEEVAKAEGLYARGGLFGTKLNLMKDGARHTGDALGKFLLHAMRTR